MYCAGITGCKFTQIANKHNMEHADSFIHRHTTTTGDKTAPISANNCQVQITRSPVTRTTDTTSLIWTPSTPARHESACRCNLRTESDHRLTTLVTNKPVPLWYFPSLPASAHRPQSYPPDPKTCKHDPVRFKKYTCRLGFLNRTTTYGI